MGFYTEALNGYRQNAQTDIDLTTRLQNAKQLVDQKYADRVHELVDQNKILQTVNSYGRSFDYSLYDSIHAAQQEFSRVVFQSPEEFFAGVASLEELGLRGYITHCQTEQNSTQAKLDNLENGSGFLNRLGDMFGLKQNSEAKLTNKLAEQNHNIQVAGEAYQDWQKLTPEDKIEYELCKFENDQTMGFDCEALKQYDVMKSQAQIVADVQ